MLSDKIKELYKIVNELEREYPGRKFTIDGHLIGSIGEVIVGKAYGLKLLPVGVKIHDAITEEGRLVQIKATQKNRVALSSEPQYLIVIKVLPDGSWNEVYNGPGDLVWEKACEAKNKMRLIALSKLKFLMESVPEEEKIPRIL